MPTCYEQYVDAEAAILDSRPFYYYYSGSAPYTESKTVAVAAIELEPLKNTMRLLLNPDVYPTFDLEGAMTVLAHEILHVVFEHIFSPHIHHDLWNVAIDLCVNSLLLNQKFKLPLMLNPKTGKMEEIGITPENQAKLLTEMWTAAGKPQVIAPPPYEMSAEWYLTWLLENTPPEAKQQQGSSSQSAPPGSSGGNNSKGDQDGQQEQEETSGDGDQQGSPSDTGDSDSTGSGKSQLEQLYEELIDQANHDFPAFSADEKMLAKQMIAEAVKHASENAPPPGNIAGRCQELVKSLRPKVNPETLIKRFVGMQGSLDLGTSCWRKNKYGGTPRITPRPRRRILFVLDSSGSMSTWFLAYLLGIAEDMSRYVDIDVMYVDAIVHGIFPLKQSDRKKGYDVIGRGGTDMRKVFYYLNDNPKLDNYDGIVIGTDLGTPFPKRADLRGRKVLWVGVEKLPVPVEAGPVVYVDPKDVRKTA